MFGFIIQTFKKLNQLNLICGLYKNKRSLLHKIYSNTGLFVNLDEKNKLTPLCNYMRNDHYLSKEYQLDMCFMQEHGANLKEGGPWIIHVASHSWH